MSVAADRLQPGKRVLPELAAIRSLPAAISGSVTETDVDVNGHMNILSYIQWSSLAIDAVLKPLGLNDHYHGVRRLSFFTSEQHVSYFAEQALGDAFSVYVRVVDRSDKVVHAMAYLVSDTHDALASTFEVVFVHVGLDSRCTVPMPEEMAGGLDRLVERDRALAWDAGLSGAMGVRRG